ncbi:MAG: Clp protease N-terminal domain-containing protein [Actinomycetota bacterium]
MTGHLLGLTEIAELLGVSRQRVDQLSNTYADFPRPEADLASGRVWSKAAIEGWLAVHPERAPGRVEGASIRFDRLTGRARNVFVHAQAQSASLHHSHVGCEHLLLGILTEAESLGAKALVKAGLTLDRARACLDAGSAPGPGGRIFTPRVHRALAQAQEAALELGHNYVGTEHLVLGILQEGDNLAHRILEDNAIDPDAVRTALFHEIGLPVAAGREGLTPPPWRALLEQLTRIESRLSELEHRLSSA